MGRLALRPGLRAYAHAPAGAEEAFENILSLDFDGVDSYARSSGYVSTTVLSGAMSFSCWIKLDTLTGGWGAALYVGSAASYYTGRIWLSVSGAGIMGRCVGPTVNYLNHTLAAADVWYHYVVTDSRTTASTGDCKLYIDGVKVDEELGQTALSTPGADWFVQAGRLGDSADYWEGNVDEVSIWSVELSQSQINDLYGSGPTDLTGSAGLEHWYRMGDAISGATVPDQHGSTDMTTYGTSPPAVDTDVPS